MMLFEIPDTQKSVTERICRKRGKEKNESDFWCDYAWGNGNSGRISHPVPVREPCCGAGTENIRKGCSWKILIRLKNCKKQSRRR